MATPMLRSAPAMAQRLTPVELAALRAEMAAASAEMRAHLFTQGTAALASSKPLRPAQGPPQPAKDSRPTEP
jgi:hypothetical protein